MAGNPWTDADERLMQYAYPHMGRQLHRAFEALGRPRSMTSVKNKAKHMGLEFSDYRLPPPPPDADWSPNEAKALAAAWEAIEARMSYGGPGAGKHSHTITPKHKPPPPPSPLEVAEQMQGYLNESLEQAGRIKFRSPKLAPQRRVLCFAHSDAHYGDVVYHPATGELVYDPDICLERVRAVPAMLQQVCPPDSVDGVVVWWMGDQITGEQIYPHQAHEIGLCLADQVGDFHWHQWALVTELASIYGRCDVYCVPGNHGRAGKRHAPKTNWDRMLAQFMQLHAHYHSGRNVSVELCDQNIGVWEVLGHRVLVRHIGVSQDDTPARRVKLAAWHDIHGYDLLVHGHLHTGKQLQYHGRPVVSNGSMKDPGAYVEELGRWGKPGQEWWIMDTERPYRYGGRLEW
jgi:predicted phosphodiesterase